MFVKDSQLEAILLLRGVEWRVVHGLKWGNLSANTDKTEKENNDVH